MNFITQDDDIKVDNGIQALYFYASWMPYHNKFLTMISKIEKKYNTVFYGIDVDQFKNQCKRFNISSIPTVLIYKNENIVKKITGLVLTSAFNSAFVDIYNTTHIKDIEC